MGTAFYCKCYITDTTIIKSALKGIQTLMILIYGRNGKIIIMEDELPFTSFIIQSCHFISDIWGTSLPKAFSWSKLMKCCNTAIITRTKPALCLRIKKLVLKQWIHIRILRKNDLRNSFDICCFNIDNPAEYYNCFFCFKERSYSGKVSTSFCRWFFWSSSLDCKRNGKD